MRITLSPYTMATNCTDIIDCNDGISELWDACDRYKAAGQKVPEYIYKRIKKLEAKRDKCSLKEHGMNYDDWLLSRFNKLEGVSGGYIDAYNEALRAWLNYQNYKGDKRTAIYRALKNKADSAREFLMQTPQELPNFLKINAWYFDEDITDYNTMVERIFGGLQGTKKAPKKQTDSWYIDKLRHKFFMQLVTKARVKVEVAQELSLMAVDAMVEFGQWKNRQYESPENTTDRLKAHEILCCITDKLLDKKIIAKAEAILAIGDMIRDCLLDFAKWKDKQHNKGLQGNEQSEPYGTKNKKVVVNGEPITIRYRGFATGEPYNVHKLRYGQSFDQDFLVFIDGKTYTAVRHWTNNGGGYTERWTYNGISVSSEKKLAELILSMQDNGLQGTKKTATALTVTVFKFKAVKTPPQTFKRRSTTTKSRLVSYTVSGTMMGTNINNTINRAKLLEVINTFNSDNAEDFITEIGKCFPQQVERERRIDEHNKQAGYEEIKKPKSKYQLIDFSEFGVKILFRVSDHNIDSDNIEDDIEEAYSLAFKSKNSPNTFKANDVTVTEYVFLTENCDRDKYRRIAQNILNFLDTSEWNEDFVKHDFKNPDDKKPLSGTNDNDNFKRWFSGSKVVDADGRPLVVYHGTTKDFTTFSKEKIGKANNGRYGFFFTPDESLATDFTRRRWQNPESQPKKNAHNIAVYLNLRNPLIVTAYQYVMNAVDNMDLSKYDGIIITPFSKEEKARWDSIWGKNSGSKEFDHNQYVVFSPNQIKSATRNNGNFSPESDNILEGVSGTEIAAAKPKAQPTAQPTAEPAPTAEPKPGELTEAEKEKLRSYQGKGGKGKETTERGILDEYYTPDYVCEFMYQLAVRYGYTAGKVLEPSCATGNCIRPIYERNDYTHIDAFEINQTSREICKKLYPNVTIYENYFETAFLEQPRFSTKAKKTWLENAPYDLIIGNPPYGKHVNRYSSYFGGKDHFEQIEMFFMAKALELLRSGGLLIYITSTNFMSTGNKYQQAKERIAAVADFVDAYRLPKVFANTDICTDIIVLRKK